MHVEATRRRRLEPDARREQILAVAIRYFGERPYSEVSTTDVARAAGVARGLVNHYFGTKKELYLEVVRVMLTVPGVAVERLAQGEPDERVDAIFTWEAGSAGFEMPLVPSTAKASNSGEPI